MPLRAHAHKQHPAATRPCLPAGLRSLYLFISTIFWVLGTTPLLVGTVMACACMGRTPHCDGCQWHHAVRIAGHSPLQSQSSTSCHWHAPQVSSLTTLLLLFLSDVMLVPDRRTTTDRNRNGSRSEGRVRAGGFALHPVSSPLRPCLAPAAFCVDC